MRLILLKVKYLFILFFLLTFFRANAENSSLKVGGQQNEIFIESNTQRSDPKNSIFYAEGDVIITNNDKEFIAKSQKAIFYKSTGKIKLIGNVQVITKDSNNMSAGEILYSLKENTFEAISDTNQRVNTKFVFDERNILNNQE